MQLRHWTLLASASLLLAAPLLRAQHAADPSGHWEGAVHMPDMEVNIQIDLATKPNGNAVATFTGVNISGYPLSDVALEGSSIRFQLKVDGGGAFRGTLSEDGKSMKGDFTSVAGGYTLPFDLQRSGDARFAAPVANPAIGKDLEGRWAGTLDVNGVTMRIGMTMANRPDGTSTGSLANLDQGAVEIPIATISQTRSDVAFEVKVVNGSYSGVLSAAGTELAGTWTQGSFTTPLTFTKVR